MLCFTEDPFVLPTKDVINMYIVDTVYMPQCISEYTIDIPHLDPILQCSTHIVQIIRIFGTILMFLCSTSSEAHIEFMCYPPIEKTTMQLELVHIRPRVMVSINKVSKRILNIVVCIDSIHSIDIPN